MSTMLSILLDMAFWFACFISLIVVILVIWMIVDMHQIHRKGLSIEQWSREETLRGVKDEIMQMPSGQKERVKQWFLERISQIDTGEAVALGNAGPQSIENGTQKDIHGIGHIYAQKGSHSRKDVASNAQNPLLKEKNEKENSTEPIHRSDEKEFENTSNTTETRPCSQHCSTQISEELSGVKQLDVRNTTALQHIDVNHRLEHRSTIQPPRPPDGLPTSLIPDHDKPIDIRTALIRDTKTFMENLESRRRPSRSEQQHHIKNYTKLNHTSDLPAMPLKTSKSSLPSPHNDEKTPSSATEYRYTKSDLHKTRKANKAHMAKEYPSNSLPIPGDQKAQASSFFSSSNSEPTHEESTEDFLKRIDHEHGLGLTFQKGQGKAKEKVKEEMKQDKFDVQADFDNAQAYDWDSEVARKRRERMFPAPIVADEAIEEETSERKGIEYGDGIKEVVSDMEDEEDEEEWETLDKNKVPKEGLTWKEEMDWKLMSSWRKHNNMEPFW